MLINKVELELYNEKHLQWIDQNIMNRMNLYKHWFFKIFQAARDAKIRLEKTEEEATELSNKAKTLEVRKSLGIGAGGE